MAESGVALPHAEEPGIMAEVLNRLVTYLTEGSVEFSIAGLNQSPIFVRHGRDVEGDPTTTETAAVILDDDKKGGKPHVKIEHPFLNGLVEDWGDDEEIFPVAVVLDCAANEYNGAISPGVSATTADETLRGAVFKLLRHEAAMEALGFSNVRVVGQAPDKEGVQYSHPLTLQMDVYVLKDV